jgi:hypothetical protein
MNPIRRIKWWVNRRRLFPDYFPHQYQTQYWGKWAESYISRESLWRFLWHGWFGHPPDQIYWDGSGYGVSNDTAWLGPQCKCGFAPSGPTWMIKAIRYQQNTPPWFQAKATDVAAKTKAEMEDYWTTTVGELP